jgi:hypothetical protein
MKRVVDDASDRFEFVKITASPTSPPGKQVSVTATNPTQFTAVVQRLSVSAFPESVASYRTGQSATSRMEVASRWSYVLQSSSTPTTGTLVIPDVPNQTILIGPQKSATPTRPIQPQPNSPESFPGAPTQPKPAPRETGRQGQSFRLKSS